MNRRPRAEHGESLIEILIAIVIMGISISALVSGLAAASRGADLRHDQAAAAGHLLTASEAVKATGYAAACTAPATYLGRAQASLPAAWKTRVTAAVKYWSPAGESFDGTCREDPILSGVPVDSATYTTTTNRYTRIVLQSGTVTMAMQGLQVDFTDGPLAAATPAAITAVDVGLNALTIESMGSLPARGNKFDVVSRAFQRLQQVTLTMTLPQGGTSEVIVVKRFR